MTDIIIHKHSITAGDAPEPAELNLGELAIQAADGHIYLKKTDGTVVRVTMLPGGTQQQVLYKTGAGDYALGWGTISSALMGGTLWSEVVAEVQRVFALVEGTASVLLSAPATLTAGSTGPITVSVADTDYLTDGTSITGVLGTVYGTLSRSGSTYSFESVQSYTGDVNFLTGTRFAAAFLNDTFNPLRIGSAEVEDDNGYTESSGYSHAVVDSSGRIGYGVKDDGTFDVPSGDINLDDAKIQEDVSFADGSGYARVEVDENGRIAWGIKSDGTVAIKKALVEGNSTVQGNGTFESDVTIQGDLTVQGTTVTIDVTDLTIEDNTILLNKGESGSGVSLGSAGIEVDRGTADNVKLEWNEANQAWTAKESIRTNSSVFFGSSSSENDDGYTEGSGYYQAVLDSSNRIGYGLKDDGSFDINGAVATKKDSTYDHLGYSYVIVDADDKIAFGVTTAGEVYTSAIQASYTESVAHGSSGLYTVIKDAFGRTQIQAGQDSGVNILTSAGNNWGPVVTAETPERIAFLSDRNKDADYNSRHWVMNNDGTRQAPATPNKNDITFWGDSMTQRLQSYAHLPGLLSGRTITYNALGGTSIEHILARHGGENATCTIPSGSIPASGSVALQNVYPSLGYHAGTLSVGDTYAYKVLIEGIEGTLTSTTNASSQADYTFTRTNAGSVVSVDGSVEIIVLSNITQGSFGFSKQNTGVFWMGTNPLSRLPSSTYDPNSGTGVYYKSPATTYDPTNSAAVQARTEAITQALLNRVENLDRHVLIVGPFIGQDQVWANRVEKQAIVAGFSTFSKHWYDLRSDFIATCKTWLQSNYPAIYANWAQTDDDHVANGAAPPILREDDIHLNTYGSDLVSELIATRLTSKNW